MPSSHGRVWYFLYLILKLKNLIILTPLGTQMMDGIHAGGIGRKVNF